MRPLLLAPALAAVLAAASLPAFPSASGLLGVAAAAQVVPDPSVLDAWMEQVRQENALPALTAAVAVDGELVFSHGVGFADLSNLVPATGRSVFNSGSVSKVLAVVGLMTLVEEGRVDLDVPIQTYLPYYPEKERPITLRHVLTHTSGIRHYRSGEFGEHGDLERRRYQDFEEATRIWRDDPLLYPTGESWLYSSHAMNLMHGVVEAAGGEGFEAYLRRVVFEPAGMLATQFDVPERIVHNRGQGYDRDDQGRYENTGYVDVSYKYAGGGMLSTVEDMVRFSLALSEGRLLEPRTFQEMIRPQIPTDIRQHSASGRGEPLDFRQALAWRVRELPGGHRVVYHTGTVKGQRSYVGFVPELGTAVALQANTLPFDSQRYGEVLLRMLLPARHAAPVGG